ncbi:DNA-methyltransferase [Granulicatella balaenopterae]|nr:site-specific DNA-methyltransferase [Granulicatella balaenopterae]
MQTEWKNKKRPIKCELYHDNFQNYKRYAIKPAQLVIADIPYNLGANAYGSNPVWYEGGDNKNGESKLAGSNFFRGDDNFNIAEFMHFCNKLVKKEPKAKNQAGAMIVFCAFEQIAMVQEYGKRHGFANSYPLIFCKKSSSQVLKANMKIVGACEYAVVLYRNKLPKFRNGVQQDGNGKNIRGTGKMIKNWVEWETDTKKEIEKIHPTQKPVATLKKLIEIFTDPGDVVIDPCAGSGATLRAARELGRHSYGFECNPEFYKPAIEKMLVEVEDNKPEQIDMLEML